MPYDIVDETTAADGTPFRVILEIDQDAQDPREEWDHAGTMVLAHRRYDLPREGDLTDRIDKAFERGGYRLAARYLRAVHGVVAVLPVYGYEHSGITFQAGKAYDDQWDSGLAGLIYLSAEAARTGWTDLGYPMDQERAEALLHSEVEEYAAWSEGGVFGYVVQRGELDDDGDVLESSYADTHELDDSLWGLIGEEYAQREARNALANAVDAYNTDVAQDAQRAAADEDEIESLRRTELGMVTA